MEVGMRKEIDHRREIDLIESGEEVRYEAKMIAVAIHCLAEEVQMLRHDLCGESPSSDGKLEEIIRAIHVI